MTTAGALTALTRLAARRPDQRRALELALRGRLEELAHIALDIAVETGGPIGSVLAEVIEREGSVDLVESILTRFDKPRYHDSVALSDTVLVSTQKALVHLQEIAAIYGEERVAEIARRTSNMSFSLSRLGRQEEARTAARHAVEAFRSLSSEGRKYEYELSVSLSNLGVIESTLGNYEVAMPVTEEAVRISRRLSEKWPVEAAPILAQGLINLGSIFFSFGSGERALEATREAFEILKQLAVEDPGVFSNLARSLNNLGAILRSLGHFEDALEVTTIGLDLLRALAADSLDIARSMKKMELDLFDRLENLAASLLEVSKRGPALRAIVESIDILQKDEAQRPAEAANRLRAVLERLTVALEEPDSTGDPTKRIASLEHVVRSVSLFFQRQPLIFADPMNTALLTYLTTLLRVGKEPDRELLRPIIKIIEKEILGSSSAPL